MSDYTPSWVQPDEVPETPPEERYGSGTDFHDDSNGSTAPDRTVGSASNRTDLSQDSERSSDHNTSTTQEIAETPEWVDDSIAVMRDDLTPDEPPAAPCQECIDAPARAVYQSPTVEHTSAYFQLFQRHGLQYIGEGDWLNGSGLTVDVDRFEITDYGANPSYITVRGPDDAVAAFVRDLLDVSKYIKRELRAPAPVRHADAAQADSRRVDDKNRLVDRGVAAGTVARLPESEEGAE